MFVLYSEHRGSWSEVGIGNKQGEKADADHDVSDRQDLQRREISESR